MQSSARDFNPKHMSQEITQGPERAPARTMLRATGLDDAALANPFVGIANLASDVTPCNMHLGRLTVRIKEGIRAAGGTPFRVRDHHGQRRHLDGHRGHEGLPGQPRGDRRLH